MKSITESRLTHILAAHPNARVKEVQGVRIVKIPQYDIDRDEAYTVTMRVVPDPVETPKGILPVLTVRSGAKARPEGDVRVSPLGHLYRILGYTPPARTGQTGQTGPDRPAKAAKTGQDRPARPDRRPDRPAKKDSDG
jgi:hypothetical protein